MNAELRGIISIPVTPFDSTGALDEPSLREEVAFALACGSHGLLVPVNASEWYTLSDDERKRITQITLAEAREAVPVVVGVTAQSANLSIELARHAQDLGAFAVNAMPPHVLQLDAGGCFQFYRELSSSVDIPVMVQNYYPPIGTPMSTDLLARLVRELDNVYYVKEETPPEPHNISRLLQELAGDKKLRGVFGGQGGLYLIDELTRGVSGNMPATHAADALVQVWELWEKGAADAAREVQSRLLPLMVFERCYGGSAVYKEVLYRRGVISTTMTRSMNSGLDSVAKTLLTRILDDIEDLFRVAPPSA
jgi:dihydrodipicolinate synthase/N-acetylneuraminate lyase